jgi:hypothetical protein
LIVGLHGTLMFVKQWQQPFGHVHSEQRWRQTVPVLQQNHSPKVEHSPGQPPAAWHGLHGCDALRLSHVGQAE